MKNQKLIKDIILAGVGGQGILSIAAVIDWAALESGLNIKQAEVHGMSQRGGAVQSHLRISDQMIYSDLIQKGSADLIISLEPMEALRYIPYLKEDGWVISSSNTFKNIENYPDEEKLAMELNRLPRKIVVDAERIARTCGSIKTTNMVMLGAASSYIGIDTSTLLKGIEALFADKGQEIITMNKEAFQAGLEAQEEIAEK
jgi:indolepyruvate ferredoxin oxidoreductase, beta subunit